MRRCPRTGTAPPAAPRRPGAVPHRAPRGPGRRTPGRGGRWWGPPSRATPGPGHSWAPGSGENAGRSGDSLPYYVTRRTVTSREGGIIIPDSATARENRELAAALRRVVSGGVRFDSYTRHLFSRDASMYAIEPLGVAFPRDGDDAAAVVATAARFGVPVLPRGAGTSLAGQTVGRAVVMDFSRHMSRILAIDAEARRARVQPGVVQEQLNRAAAHGLMFGPDTSTSNRATLGGMIGNNSAGSHSVRYGMTVDHVLTLDVVLSDASRAVFGPLPAAEVASRAARPTLDGAICRELPLLAERNAQAIATGYPRFWRQSGGYRLDRLAGRGGPGGMDLARFVVGSEGTLVTVVEADVALVPAPRHRVIAVGHFTSSEAAIDATGDALACKPAAVELMDRTILELARAKLEYSGLSSILSGDPDALMFVTFFGDTEAEAAAGLDRLDALWRRHRHGYHTLRARSAADQAALLKVRQSGLGLLMSASTGPRRPLAFVEDTAVDPAVLGAYTRRFREVLSAHGLSAGFYGHASVGCLHVRPFVDLTEPGQVQAMRAVAEEIRDLVLEFGGVNSSEHGDGLARSEFNRTVFGDPLYGAMREVKRLFDADNRMNPGKIVDAPPMTSNLREAAAPSRPGYVSKIHFEVPGGMRGAADRCMNIGLCRKTSAGVMCPSYMATREEEHSTRGRAGALVKALDSADPRAALGDERLHEILDLCLECKACKSECPLGVDMASLKAEALAAYHAQHGVPLRSRMFGSIRALNRLGSAAAPLANLVGGRPGGWRPPWPGAWVRPPPAACRSWRSSRHACSRCGTNTPLCYRVIRERRRWRKPPASRRNSSWKRSPPAGSACRRRTTSAGAASCSTATATRRRWRARPRRWPCCAASQARTSLRLTLGAAAWPARSVSRPSTTSCPCVSANSGSSPPSAPSRRRPSSRRRVSRAASR